MLATCHRSLLYCSNWYNSDIIVFKWCQFHFLDLMAHKGEVRMPFFHTMQNMTKFSSFLVSVSPIIVTVVGQVSCRIGASTVLPCRAVGLQPITYTWTRGRAETQSPISPTEHRHIDGESKVWLELFIFIRFFTRFSLEVVFSSKHELYSTNT